MDRHVTDYLDARLSLYDLSVARPVAGAVTGPLARLSAWREKRRVRRDLEALDDRLLADIGLDRAAIGPLVDGMVADGAGRRPIASDIGAVRAA